MFDSNDYIAFMTSVQGHPAEVWWRKETHGFEEESHYWLKVPEALAGEHHKEPVWMQYHESTGSLVRPTRPLWGLKVEQDNKLEWESWKHDNHVSGGTSIEITLHGKVVWRCGSYNNLFRAVAYAQSIILRLADLPVDLNAPERDLKDRRIWYHDQPGIIRDYEMPGDRLIIEYDDPDESKGFNMMTAWKLTDKDPIPDAWHGSHIVHDSIFSDHIWWFRDEGATCPPGRVGPR